LIVARLEYAVRKRESMTVGGGEKKERKKEPAGAQNGSALKAF